MKFAHCGLFAGAFALSGCGNPVEQAATAVAGAAADWATARGELDPSERLELYDEVIADVEAIVEDYAETPAAQALGAGRSVGNVSLTEMRAARADLAARADCYASPTAECLRPFVSRSFRDDASGADSSEAAFAASQTLVCERGFAAADRALEPFKINRPVYSQQLVQVALAAAQCGKPAEVKAAVEAYMTAEPASGDERVGSYLSILATPELEPAWATIVAELEQSVQSRALDESTAATVALTLADRYAMLGDTRAALAKFAYFTDTLGYQADFQSLRDLAAKLAIAGAADQGFGILGSYGNQKSNHVIVLHEAAAELGRRLGLVGDGAALPQLSSAIDDIDEYFAPIEADERARFATAAAAVEAELDEIAPTVTVRDGAIGLSGLDTAYGVIAFVHQKLGAADRAAGAIAKAMRVRGALLAPGAENVAQEYIAPFQSLIAIAQGKYAEAAAHAQRIGAYRNEHARLILRSLATSGDVEQALTLANELAPGQGGTTYSIIIGALIDAGELDKAEQVINAFSGDPGTKAQFHWQLVTKAANDGDRRGAEQAAEKFGLLRGSGDRLRLLTVLLGSAEIAGDRDEAEPIIREIFTLGQEIDRASAGNAFSSDDQYYAQNAAAFAFKNGYTELGLELYRAALRKDQRPLFEAFNDKTRDGDLTEILMTAHDNLAGEELGYVIAAAVRHLERQSG